jgi:hypothetical protein
MTHHFVHIICIVIFSHIWNDFILVMFSNDILNFHVILSLIIDATWMKIGNEIAMSSFLLSRYHLLIKCTTNIRLQHFPHKI